MNPEANLCEVKYNLIKPKPQNPPPMLHTKYILENIQK